MRGKRKISELSPLDKRGKRKCCIFSCLFLFKPIFTSFMFCFKAGQPPIPLTLPQTRFLPHKPLKKKLRRCQNRRSFSSRFFQIVIVALHSGSSVFHHRFARMCVDVERKGRGSMTEQALHALDVCAGGNGDRSRRVS